jgi:hypothetical protein
LAVVHDCPHLPPYAETRPPTAQDFTSTKKDGTIEFFPDGLHYYSLICKCRKPCGYARMMVNRYLPWTRFRLANGEMFEFGHSIWTNPVLARTPGECIRAARGHTRSAGQVNSPWHRFWFAVHHLGGHGLGLLHASQENVDTWISWLSDKLKPNIENFDSVKNTFKKAGLLEEGGLGDGKAAVRAKFLLADEMIKHYDLCAAPNQVKMQRSAGEEEDASRAQTPSKRLRMDVRPQDNRFPAPQNDSLHPPSATSDMGAAGESVDDAVTNLFAPSDDQSDDEDLDLFSDLSDEDLDLFSDLEAAQSLAEFNALNAMSALSLSTKRHERQSAIGVPKPWPPPCSCISTAHPSSCCSKPNAKEEEIKEIEGSLGRIHMVLAWLHVFFVLYGPGADEAGVIPEGRDESPNSFIRIEGQSIKPRLLFQCMYCPLTKFLRSVTAGGAMSFEVNVWKNLRRPFGLSNPVSFKITQNMEVSDKLSCGDHNGCLMHRLFKTVIGGVNCLSQEDLESLCSEVILPDKTKIRKIERELKMLEGAHLNSLNTIRGLDVDAYFLNDEAAEAEAARIAAEAEAERAAEVEAEAARASLKETEESTEAGAACSLDELNLGTRNALERLRWTGQRQSSGTQNGENPAKKMQNESRILDFFSAGSKQAYILKQTLLNVYTEADIAAFIAQIEKYLTPAAQGGTAREGGESRYPGTAREGGKSRYPVETR